jgi:transcriptional regulator with XRE-family HTH domain
MEIGAALKRLREARGLTQTELAVRAGLSQGYIAKLEPPNRPGQHKASHQTNPSLTVLTQLATGLGITVEHLLRESRRSE